MDGIRWPAVAIQGVFLAANISFLLAGKNNGFIIASTTFLIFLFVIQVMSKNPRFLYLFPIHTENGTRTPTPSWDTGILRTLLILSILSFYVGATDSYLFAFLILVIGVLFPIIWDKYMEGYNTKKINKLIKKAKKASQKTP